MSDVLVLGCKGKQGSAVCDGLAQLGISWSEIDIGEDVESFIAHAEPRYEIVVSCLPYDQNEYLSTVALKTGSRWIDIGGHVQTSLRIREEAKRLNKLAITDAGLAPGLVEYLGALAMIKRGKAAVEMNLYCGVLPTNFDTPFGYSELFSMEGLVNEYVDECYGIVGGRRTSLIPMSDERLIELDGQNLAAVNTSGALTDAFIENLLGNVRQCRYRTLRYAGHWDLVKHAWKKTQDREQFKKWLEIACYKTTSDVALLGVEIDEDLRMIRIKCTNKYTAMQRGTAFPVVALVKCVLEGEFCDHQVINPHIVASSDLFWEILGELINELNVEDLTKYEEDG